MHTIWDICKDCNCSILRRIAAERLCRLMSSISGMLRAEWWQYVASEMKWMIFSLRKVIYRFEYVQQLLYTVRGKSVERNKKSNGLSCTHHRIVNSVPHSPWFPGIANQLTIFQTRCIIDGFSCNIIIGDLKKSNFRLIVVVSQGHFVWHCVHQWKATYKARDGVEWYHTLSQDRTMYKRKRSSRSCVYVIVHVCLN